VVVPAGACVSAAFSHVTVIEVFVLSLNYGALEG
jgi:hypothetical protein